MLDPLTQAQHAEGVALRMVRICAESLCAALEAGYSTADTIRLREALRAALSASAIAEDARHAEQQALLDQLYRDVPAWYDYQPDYEEVLA
jgi:hypothetical protein